MKDDKVKNRAFGSIFKAIRRKGLLQKGKERHISEHLRSVGFDQFTVNLEKIGRHYYFNAYVIRISDDVVLFPLEGVAAKENRYGGFSKNQSDFLRVGWFFAPYVKRGVIQDINKFVYEAEEEKRFELLGELLPGIYNLSHFADFYENRYSKIPFISEYKDLIWESIQSYAAGLRKTPTATLIIAIEGTVRKLGTSLGVSNDAIGKKLFISTIKGFINYYCSSILYKDYSYVPEIMTDEDFLNDTDESVSLVLGFREFVSRHLYEHTDHFVGNDELNRNGILHGFFQSYGNDYNFLKLISIVDVLCFMISWMSSEFSLLGPETTQESFKRWKYLEKIQGELQYVD